MEQNLTTGSPAKVLWKFSMPLLGSIIFQQLYNIADSFVAGKFLGNSALSAVGNAYEVTLLYLAFAFGCNVGCSVILGQYYGAGQNRNVKTAVYTTFFFTAGLCAALMVLGFLFSPALLDLIRIDKAIRGDAVTYLMIYTAGLPFLFFYNIANGIFSALGDSRTPFLFLAASSTSNIFLDIFCVTVLEMGVDGLAWATFSCQGVSSILAVAVVLRRIAALPCKEKPRHFSLPILKKILIVAVPSTLQQSFVSVGNIFIQSAVNSFGLAVTGGYSAAIKINNFAITSIGTLGTAMSNYTAQNMGAGRMDRVKEGHRSGILLGIGVGLIFTAVCLLFRSPLIGLFMNGDDPKAKEVGMLFLLIVSPFYAMISTKLISDGVLRGAAAMGSFMTATFTDLIIRVALSFLFSAQWGSIGIWLSWPVGWACGTLLSTVFYCKGTWKKQLRI